mmetsp:Transcript_111354/g.311185  ORF Transcript_111354/g.311185 Transcript_111354/m.311185 type:complete len:382 (+) Transcript_111354:81-1226(+)|eukprot:CAMPEP_0176269390 /NCGR_PEP_ID=MMETSP0121_2-20121125/44166_1 /TAXON_ID=160619 /ORGANISM="Kryptoperidinium foliaceum, Strain CCMP 1326" /LENGTH=381 /DNA_ID=CAMNT_0017609515 /DNA_START=75 /DNA_END=1220 /DNA_ORIENTATION=+
MIIVGILLEVLAAAVGTTSKQLIAYSEFTGCLWLFYLGATLNTVVGPVIDASAYAFGPQVVVAPFACLDVIFNALTAPYTLSWQRERLTEAHIAATVLVAVGAVFTAALGSVHDESLSVFDIEQRLLKPASIVYFGVEAGLILLLHVYLQAGLLSSKARGISLGVAAGVLMGNVFCMKGFISIVRDTVLSGDTVAWTRPTPYLLLLCAVGGAILGNVFMLRGLVEYKGIFMVTIFEGAHICAACLSGCIVMEEMAHAPWWQYSLYWVALWTIVAGMVLINTSAVESRLGKSAFAHQRSMDDGAQQEKIRFVPRDFAKQVNRYTEATKQDALTCSDRDPDASDSDGIALTAGEGSTDAEETCGVSRCRDSEEPQAERSPFEV